MAMPSNELTLPIFAKNNVVTFKQNRSEASPAFYSGSNSRPKSCRNCLWYSFESMWAIVSFTKLSL